MISGRDPSFSSRDLFPVYNHCRNKPRQVEIATKYVSLHTSNQLQLWATFHKFFMAVIKVGSYEVIARKKETLVNATTTRNPNTCVCV